MTFRLALRSFAAQPVRSFVLVAGFGVGIASMAGLLGVGEVILEQSRSPALDGGGDVVVGGVSGTLHSARFLTSNVLRSEPFASRTVTASPTTTSTLYLVRADGTTIVVVTHNVALAARARLRLGLSSGRPGIRRLER